MPKETKSSDQEIEQRIEVIAQLLTRFMSRRHILEYVRKKTDWNVERAQIDNYIAEAKNIIKEKTDPEQMGGIIRKNFEMLFKKNLEIEDFRECRAVLESMAKLTGVNEPENINHNISGSVSVSKWLSENAE